MKRHVYDEDFELFWDHPDNYLRKISKLACQTKWRSFKKQGILPEPEVLYAALKKQKAYHRFHKTEPRFIKHVSTWLNQGCWDDECELPNSEKSSKFNNNSSANMARLYNLMCAGVTPDKLNEFCRVTKMSRVDIEAVKNKYNRVYDVNKLVSGMLKRA
jgi:pullulanase/glycogen debranching enzyme